MSLLTIVQEAAGSLNQPVPSTVFGSTSGDAVLWRNLAQREGRDLAGRHDWQALLVAHGFVSVALVQQDGSLPSDFDHFVPDVALWDTTSSILYTGPISSNEARALVIASSSTVRAWRLYQGDILLYPAPSAGHLFIYEYITSNWCQSSGGTARSAWAADTDTALIPESLIALGLTWRWLRAKGMDYAEEMQTYERDVELAASRDRGLRTMSVGGPSSNDYPQAPFWTGTITV